MNDPKPKNIGRKTLAELAAKKTLRVAGLMSGTSADGVDVVVADIGPQGVQVVAFDSFPYPKAVRKLVFELFDLQAARVEAVCHANFLLGEVFAEAVLRLCREQGVKLASLDLIGSHGQTVCHLPQGKKFGGRLIRSTLQIGEPCVIAERTGLTTVADFRPRDVAAGGEGAPLVPYTDWLLFADKRKTRCVQNIGGIANVTFLPAGGGVDRVLAFDTGPGNMIIDRLAWLATGGKKNFDKNGVMAAWGRVDAKLLVGLLRHRYFARRPPKSTGREMFGVEYSTTLFEAAKAAGLETPDILATATAFTARTIAEAYRRFLPGRPDEVILCGGGARNPTLVEMIRSELPTARVGAMDEWGINADAKEAISFALLARETIRGAAGNVPAATGARRRVVLGKIVPGG